MNGRNTGHGPGTNENFQYWTMTPGDVLRRMNSSIDGLNESEAAKRKIKPEKKSIPFLNGLLLFFRQFKNPLTLLLVFSLMLSAFLKEYRDSGIIFAILFISAFLSFIQEKRASRAAEKLKSMLGSFSRVKRNGLIKMVKIDEVVPGDIIMLEAGQIVPADSFILEMKDLYMNESALTGESYPSEKKTGTLPGNTPVNERVNSVFRGTSVISGTALALAIKGGKESEWGKIEKELRDLKKDTAFEQGIRHFGYMLMRVALTLAGFIIIINIYFGRNPLESILFALALSVGLAPEMLPAIVTITLSAGAKRLAEKKVIVKRLSSIQNLGVIDVLCSDKTGTLTYGEVKIHSSVGAEGSNNKRLELYAYLNASFESGYPNPMDVAIREQLKSDVSDYVKCDEVPFDFIRKRLSIVVAHDSSHIMITKGAFKHVLEVCSKVEGQDGKIFPLGGWNEKLTEQYERYSREGLRVIGLCYKDVINDPLISKNDEKDMIYLGSILLYDPPKSDIQQTIKDLQANRVQLKIISGDNMLVAGNVARYAGIPTDRIISGKELYQMSDEAMVGKVSDIDIFAETEPSQKERIIRALQKKGHIVGYLGDGINDATAIKAADVGISVNNAVDVARESADMVLLEKELNVMNEGIVEGRKTYLNTLKYIFIAVSANFGNMFSMAGISLMLPFLPLLPSQILLINLLTDFPALAIASDNVDEELLGRPRKWDIKLIRRFMVVFGLESSVFDVLTFVLLLFVYHAPPEVFRTGWFVESVVTAISILLVIRSRRDLLSSNPGKVLLYTSLAGILIALATPYIPFAGYLGFKPLAWDMVLSVCVISLLYIITGELTKRIFFRKIKF